LPTHAANRETRRRRILAAARRLAAKEGIENTRMEDVARAAGCTRRTLYAYFQSWDDLFLLVFAEYLTARWQHQTDAMAEADTGLAKLRRWGEAYFDYAQRHPQSLRVQFFWDFRGIHPERLSPEVQAALEEAVEPLVSGMREIFRAGQADGSIKPDLDPDTILGQYAYTLRALMNRVLFPGHSFAEFEPLSFVHSYLDLFLDGIAAQPDEDPS